MSSPLRRTIRSSQVPAPTETIAFSTRSKDRVASTPESWRYALAMAAATLIVCVVLRIPMLDRPMAGYRDNEDATSHVLATVVASSQKPASEHHFLPLFTLSGDRNSWIDDLPSSSRFDKKGNVIYTSWPPGFFAVATGISQVFRIEPTPRYLRSFNLFLHVITCLLIGLLCAMAAALFDSSRESRLVAASVGCIVYAAAPEALKSHLFGYWAEVLYGPILVGQLLLWARNRTGPLFFLLTVLGGLVDWTAYVANAGFFLAFCIQFWTTRERRYFLAAVGTAAFTCVALGLLLGWFSTVLPLHELLSSQQKRASLRSGRSIGIILLIPGFFLSLGAFWLVPIVVGTRELARANSIRSAWKSTVSWLNTAPKPVLLLLLVTAFPLIENFVMADHAASYTYDRLKLLYVVAVALAMVVGALPRYRRMILTLTTFAAVVSISVFSYKYYVVRSADAPATVYESRFGDLIRRTVRPEALAFTNETVRGNALYYSGRNVYSNIDTLAARAGVPLNDWIRNVLRSRHEQLADVYLANPDGRRVELIRLRDTGEVESRQSFELY